MDSLASPSSSSSSGDGDRNGGGRRKKEDLGWIEWARGWWGIVGEFLFQRIAASHLENPLSLPHLDGITCIVTGATSGIGLEIARSISYSSSKDSFFFFLVVGKF